MHLNVTEIVQAVTLVSGTFNFGNNSNDPLIHDAWRLVYTAALSLDAAVVEAAEQGARLCAGVGADVTV